MKRIRVPVLFSILFLLACCIVALYLRVCPQWKPAALTIRAGKAHENPCIAPLGMTQETRLLPPEGYTRVPAEENSFLAYLRQYPLLPDGSEIPVYHGGTANPANAAAIYDISLGAEGYQQCADSVIRLYSDYFWGTGQTERIAFQFSNGFLCDYDAWRRGKRALVIGDLTFWIRAAGKDDSEAEYRNYLMEVMRYAGTLSLEAESTHINAQEAHAGDFICRGGSPGHVQLIVDEAINEAGERVFLLGQGMIPSQCFHIIMGLSSLDSPWYSEQQLAAEEIRTAGYVFEQSALRRWKDGF